MTDQPIPLAATTATGSPSGLWRDSPGRYVAGSLIATLAEALVLIVVASPLSSGWGGGLLLALMLIGTAMTLPLVPLASWIAWRLAPGGLSALPRWLCLTGIACCVSLLVLLILLTALRVAGLWLWIVLPVVGLHAWWTALFLAGRRRPAVLREPVQA